MNKQKSSIEKQLMNQVGSKIDIKNKADINLAEEKPKEEPKSKDKFNKETKFIDNEIKQDSINWKNAIKRFLFGVSFGSSSVIPGFAPSTIAETHGFLNDFRYKLGYLFKPKSFLNFLYLFLWILPVLSGLILSFALTFFIFYLIVNSGYGTSIMFSAIGVSIGFLVIYYFINKSKLPLSKKTFGDLKQNDQKPLFWLILGISIFVIFIIIGIVSKFAWPLNKNGFNLGGISLLNQEYVQNYLNAGNLYYAKQQFQTSVALLYFVSGIFTGFCFFIPGVSNGLMLSLFGSFTSAFWGTKVSFSSPEKNLLNDKLSFTGNESWPIIIVLLIGFLIGMVVNVFFINWLNKKNKDKLTIVYFFVMIGCVVSNFIAISQLDYEFLGKHSSQLGVGLGLLFIFPIVIFATYFLLSKFKIVNIEFFGKKK